MAKLALDVEEVWTIMSFMVNRLLDEVTIDNSDRAKIRRWKTGEMKVGGEELRALQEKMNVDLARLWEIRRKSAVRRPDWH